MRPQKVAALLSAAAAVGLSVVVALLALEGYLLATGQEPITWYTRCSVNAFPGIAMMIGCLVAAGAGALAAHFLWDKNRR